MRVIWVGACVLAVAGCSRNFSPPTSTKGPLEAKPSTLFLAVDESATVALSGGVPPYQVFSTVDGGCFSQPDGGGGAPWLVDGGTLSIPGCLTPGFQQNLYAQDSVGAQAEVAIIVGSAFESSTAPTLAAQGCQELSVALSGGLAPYHLVLLDGGPPTQCQGAANPVLTLTPLGLRSFSYLAPPYVVGGSNSYALQFMDQVEYSKGPQANPANVLDVELTVESPASLSPAAFAASPGALLLAVDEPGVVQLSGGNPPYRFSLPSDDACWGLMADGGEPITLDDAGVLRVPPCLVPNHQVTLAASDSTVGGSPLSIPVSVGAAFQSSVAATVVAPGCSTVQLTLNGGEEPYHLEMQDGGAVPSCNDGGLTGVGLTTFQFETPAFVPGAPNAYPLRLLDQIEFAKEGQGIAPNPQNVIDFALAVEGPPPQPFQVSPSTLFLAVGQGQQVAIKGGIPPYFATSSVDGGCPATSGGAILAIDGGAPASPGVLSFPGCLVPAFQETLTVYDSSPSPGAQLSIPVSIGSAFQASVSRQLQAQACSQVAVSLSGGESPYHLVLAGGAVPSGCGADAGPVLTLEGSLSSITFLAPAYDPTGSNSYDLQLMDEVEFEKGPQADPNTVIPFTLDVDFPVSEPTTQTVQVGALQTFAVSSLFPGLSVSYAFAYDGDSSGGSVDSTGLYTAGSNLDTVDHVVVQNLTSQSTYDVWVQVGSPTLSDSSGGGRLLAGDINGDRIDDLVFLSQGSVSGADSLQIVLGSTGPLAFSPSLNVVNPSVSDLELADVNGDGLADVLIASQGNGQSASVDCSFSTQAWCFPNGTPNLAYNPVYCGIGCLAPNYDPSGTVQSYTAPVAEPDGGLAFVAGNAQIVCSLEPGSGSSSYLCSGGCEATGLGTTLCIGWTCGPGGCETTQGQNSCSLNPDGGATCSVVEYRYNGQGYLSPMEPITCQPLGPAAFQCGPIVCQNDQRGGYDCGPRNCQVGADQNVYCVNGPCTVPSGGFDEQCFYGSNGSVCGSCQPPSPTTIATYLSLPGGGFLEADPLPGTSQGLPAELEAGQLALAGGYVVQGASAGGGTTFGLESGPLYWLNLSDVHQAELVTVAHLADGGVWAMLQTAGLQGDAGVSAQDSVVGIDAYLFPFATDGSSTPLQMSVTLSNNNSAVEAVKAVDLSGTGDESVVIVSVPLDGGPPEFYVLDAPGTPCSQLLFGGGGFLGTSAAGGMQVSFPLVDGGALLGWVGRAGSLAPGSPEALLPIDEVVRLPAAHGVAIGGRGSPNDQFVLATRGSGCSLGPTPWANLGLPQLDTGQFSSIASGDFNGDGIPDLAVSGLQQLTVYPGHLGGSFAQGDEYGLTSPVLALSTSAFADGGGLLAAIGELGTSPELQLFALTRNAARLSDGGVVPLAPVSHLAYLSEQPLVDLPVGAALVGEELWTLDPLAGGTLGLTRFPTPTRAAGGITTVLPSIPAEALGTGIGGGGPGFSTALVPVGGPPASAWLVAEVPGNPTTLFVAHLDALPDGGIATESPPAPGELLPPDSVLSRASLASGAIQVLVMEGATDPNPGLSVRTYSVAGTGLAEADAGYLDAFTLPGDYVPLCSAAAFAAVVEGGGQVLFPLETVAGCSSNIEGGCCNQSGGSSLFVYNLSDGGAEAVGNVGAGLRSSQAFASTLSDGGFEIISVSIQEPGLFGVLLQADGSWRGDPAFLSQGQYLSEAAYPSTDGVPRHVISGFSPNGVEVVAR